MNTHSIVRHLDEQGRVTIPIEIREALCIDEGTPMELSCFGNKLILTRYNPADDLADAIDTISTWLKNREDKPQIMSSLEKSILITLLKRIADYT